MILRSKSPPKKSTHFVDFFCISSHTKKTPTTLEVEDKRFSQIKTKHRKSFAEEIANKDQINYLIQGT